VAHSVEAMDALMAAVKAWNGGVLVVSHDTRFINACCRDLYVVADSKVYKHKGDVESCAHSALALSTAMVDDPLRRQADHPRQRQNPADGLIAPVVPLTCTRLYTMHCLTARSRLRASASRIVYTGRYIAMVCEARTDSHEHFATSMAPSTGSATATGDL
jgi:hypothetical protein